MVRLGRFGGLWVGGDRCKRSAGILAGPLTCSVAPGEATLTPLPSQPGRGRVGGTCWCATT